jgi:hypothetical protein
MSQAVNLKQSFQPTEASKTDQTQSVVEKGAVRESIGSAISEITEKAQKAQLISLH